MSASFPSPHRAVFLSLQLSLLLQPGYVQTSAFAQPVLNVSKETTEYSNVQLPTNATERDIFDQQTGMISAHYNWSERCYHRLARGPSCLRGLRTTNMTTKDLKDVINKTMWTTWNELFTQTIPNINKRLLPLALQHETAQVCGLCTQP